MENQTSDHMRYRVVIRGRLGEHLASAFGYLELDSRPGQTTLTGTFADQAQLHGLLDQLRDLGILLISVNPQIKAQHHAAECPRDAGLRTVCKAGDEVQADRSAHAR